MQVVVLLFNGTKWKPAFQAVGLLDETKLSPRILGQLGWQAPKLIADMVPSDDQLKSIFPRRSRINRASLFRWFWPNPKAKAKAKAKPKALAKSAASFSSLLHLDQDGPISSHTRSKKSGGASSTC